jgi:PAS domain S-box-containing protein
MTARSDAEAANVRVRDDDRSPPHAEAVFWRQELQHLNGRRALVIVSALMLNAVFFVTGTGHPAPNVLTGYATWMLIVAAVSLMARHPERAPALLTLLTASFAVDTLAVTVLLYFTGGGWWLGAVFHGVIVAIAALMLPAPQARIAFAVALGGWAALVLPPAFGWLDPDPLYGLPRVKGAFALLVTQFGLGALALAALWRLIRSQVSRTERARESNRRIVDATPYAIVTIARDGRVREANPAAQALLGRRCEELVGKGLLRFVPESHRPLTIASFERALAGEVVHFEHEIERADGVLLWGSASYAPLLLPTGETAVMAIARDLTAERAAATERDAMQRELADTRRLQSVGRLVSGVAHELNNPLTAVMTFTEQLLDEANTTTEREALTVVHQQAGRARAIVRDLLQVVRERGERERTPTDLAALLAASVRAIEPNARAASVRLALTVHQAGPPALLDADGIAQVVDNLTRNALLAAGAHGAVSLALDYAEGTGWTITCTDTGPGVADDVRAHLFEPFFTTRPVGEGTGLGLPVSLGIVEQHAGRISVCNGKDGSGVGAIFTVTLPAALAVPVVDEPPTEDVFSPMPISPDADAGVTSRPPHLLLIDDEAAIRLALERFLSRRGWTVETCPSATEGSTRLLAEGATQRFDAVICDLKMQGMSGIELYRLLEQEQPQLIDRLVLVTGDVASQDVARFLETVRCPVLEKPFALTGLAEVLARISGRTPTG